MQTIVDGQKLVKVGTKLLQFMITRHQQLFSSAAHFVFVKQIAAFEVVFMGSLIRAT